MLDFELAEIYGFTTSAFNQQVKRNEDRFDDDFRFQLTREEVESLSLSHFVTSIQTKGVKGGRAKLPWAFTQSGVYMLMTVLKGDLAIRQSKALIRAFRVMKDYITETQRLITQRDLHCGASSKDAAVKLTTAITEMMSEDMKEHMHELIEEMKGNPELVLR